MLVDEACHFVYTAIDDDVQTLLYGVMLFDLAFAELFRHFELRESIFLLCRERLSSVDFAMMILLTMYMGDGVSSSISC